jgi:hypothetical protein
VFAALLIVVFEASVTRLIQLYIIGVFTSFTFGQAGMVKHWNRLLRAGLVTAERRPAVLRSRAINLTGAVLTGLVLVIVTVTKFTHGAVPGAHRHAGPLRAHARHPPALRVGRRGAGARGRAGAAAQPQPRDRAGVQGARADPARAGLRPAPPGRTT